MEVTALRAKHPRLIYQSFNAVVTDDVLEVEYTFLLEPDIVFHPRATFPLLGRSADQLDHKTLEWWLFTLGLAELASYWKTACPPEIVIKAGTLSPEQIEWWHHALLSGLGEFFYTNDIDFTQLEFLRISNASDASSLNTITGLKPTLASNTDTQPYKTAPRYLVPVGGGKDSALVLSLLKAQNLPFDCLVLSPASPAAVAIAETAHPHTLLQPTRTIDPTLLELNAQGYLNGHTPFSLYLAFASSFAAWLQGNDAVVLANEQSANEANVTFHGQPVNHQWSKSFEFENMLRKYLEEAARSLHAEFPSYFSLLRPLHELQIAQLFAAHPEYHTIFRSCNVGQKAGVWCHHCPKCLFVFMMLHSFLDETVLSEQIFTHNLFSDESLYTTLLALLGKDAHKPFECVGTFAENAAALQLSIEKYAKVNKNLPILLEKVKNELLQFNPVPQSEIASILQGWSEDHNIPTELASLLRSELAATQ